MIDPVWARITAAKVVRLRQVASVGADYADALVNVCGPDPAVASFLFTEDMPETRVGALVNRIRGLGIAVEVQHLSGGGA